MVEASTLGLAPGQWPEMLTYEGLRYRRDNFEQREGEIISVAYICLSGGGKLTVLND